MVTYKVVVTPMAQNSLRRISDRIKEEVSAEVAAKVRRAIGKTIKSLARFPESLTKRNITSATIRKYTAECYNGTIELSTRSTTKSSSYPLLKLPTAAEARNPSSVGSKANPPSQPTRSKKVFVATPARQHYNTYAKRLCKSYLSIYYNRSTKLYL